MTKLTTPCVEWPGVRNKPRYKRLALSGKRRMAHRMIWELNNGPIPAGLCICHHCDNPSCLNIDHLFLGTYKDNVHDMIAKGRHPHMVGTPALSETQVAQTAPREKPYKVYDQGGLYLFVSPHGTKSWRFDYRLHGKRETLTIGKFPEVSLEEARRRHVEARATAVLGVSPAQQKQAEKHEKEMRRAKDNVRQRIGLTGEMLMRQLEEISAMCETLKRELRGAL